VPNIDKKVSACIKTHDLEIAKTRLKEKSLTLSIIKDGKILFETTSKGISGLLKAIEKFGNGLKDASLADKVAGKAIALLCVYSKIKAIYAVTLSENAERILDKYKVYHECENLVKNVLDGCKREVCPFEKLVSQVSNPKEAYLILASHRNL